MKIRNIFNILAASLVAVTMASCDDWLDYTPKDKTTAEQQFSTRDGFYSAVNGVYTNITTSSLYGNNLTYGAIDLMGKRYESGSSNTETKYLWANFKFTDSSISSAANSIWQAAYQDILNINVILQNVDSQQGVLNDLDRNLIRGDMLGLRAYLHFDMLRLFGHTYSKDSTSAAIPYADVAEAKAYDLESSHDIIYKHLLPDLEEAEKCLKDYDPVTKVGVADTNNTNGDNYRNYRQLRMNYYAVILLKARIYLWAGNTAMALAEARRITDSGQVKEFFPFINSDKLLGNVLTPDRVFSTEVLFGFYNADRDNIYTSTFDGFNINGKDVLRPRAGFIDALFTNQGDYRLQSQWGKNGSYYNFIKYKGINYDKDNPTLYALFMPLMRISEAYYIAAECLADQGNTEGAISYLNTILNARGASPLEAGSDARTISQEIIKEYQREFWGEGQVFYMFKRNYMTINAENNADNTNTVYAGYTTNYVLPTPSSEQENR